MLLKTTVLTGFLALFANGAFADLKWDKPIQEFRSLPDAKHIEAHFTFKNTGSTPVTIQSVKTSCGCTTARLDKKTYQPGEQGEIVADYNFHGQTGSLRKLVTVVSDDHPDQPTILDIRAFVHEPFEVKPGLVFWRTGEAPQSKTVQLLANGHPVQIKNVTSSNPRITAKLETVKAGEQYMISITPANTGSADAAQITVQTDFPSESPRVYTVHARIK